MNCRTCSKPSRHVEKGTNIPFCSKPCQFIGNDIMNLPDELIEMIVDKMDEIAIFQLIKVDPKIKNWLLKREKYSKTIEKMLEFKTVNELVDYYIRMGRTVMTDSYMFYTTQTFDYYNEEEELGQEYIIFAFNDREIPAKLINEGIIGNFWNYATEDGYKFHMWFKSGFAKLLDVIGYKYISIEGLENESSL